MTTRRPLTADAPQGFEPVVLEFRGKLSSIEDIDQPPDDRYPNSRARRVVKFAHTEIEVIESKQPYAFPIFTVQMNYSPAQDQPWSVFTDSFRAVAPEGELDIYALEGKVVHWKWSPCQLSRPKAGTGQNGGTPEFELQDSKAWKIVSVEGWGESGPQLTTEELIKELVAGKTFNEFTQAYYSDNRLRSSSGYIEASEKLAKGTLLDEMVARGVLSKDDEGRYQVA